MPIILDTSPQKMSLRTQLRDTPTVKILVGPSTKPTQFLIHRSLLTTKSSFFAAALNGKFQESHTQTVNLPEEKPDTFAYFAQWLYTHDLQHEEVDVSDRADGKEGDEATRKARKPAYFKLLHLYALADRLGVEALRNQIVDRIIELAQLTNSLPTPSDTYIVYDDIRDTARLRKLLVDLFIHKRTKKLLDTHEDEWHQRFLRDLLMQYISQADNANGVHVWKETPLRKMVSCSGCIYEDSLCSECEKCGIMMCSDCLVLYEINPEGFRESPCLANQKKAKVVALRENCYYHEHKDTESCAAQRKRRNDRRVRDVLAKVPSKGSP